MKLLLLAVIVVVSTATPIAESQDRSLKTGTSITENLQKFRDLVLDRFEQIRTGRSANKRQTNSTENVVPVEKPTRNRNSKIMRFDEPITTTTEEAPPQEEEHQQELEEKNGNNEQSEEKIPEKSEENEEQREEEEKTEEGEEEDAQEHGNEDNLKKDENIKTEVDKRKQKHMNYFPYQYQRHLYNYDYNPNPNLGYYYNPNKDYPTYNFPDEWLGRTEPFKRKNSQGLIDSPIYYIRLPPSPYVFVPGMGYVSRPPSLNNEPEVVNSIPNSDKPDKHNEIHPSQFLHVPIDFVSNGKPTNIYQLPNDHIKPVHKPIEKPEVYLDKGPYFFNGRPIDIYILRNSYNSLYADALTNFYP